MKFAKQVHHAVLATLAVAMMLHAAPSGAQDATDQDVLSGVRIQLDNDLFAGRHLDRDYTGGMGVTISGTSARDGLLSLDPLLATIDEALQPAPAAGIQYARQIGLMAFTPHDIVADYAQQDDRPYASMLFLSNGRVYVDADDRGAWSSSVTIGVLGLSVSEDLHGAVHELVGSEVPRGYDHQISAGGEPTARYSIARHHLWIADPTGHVDVKTTIEGSVGYLTQTSAAISMRIGRFDTPWWSFAPELADYMAAPVPVDADTRLDELYLFAGVRLKARAYNAFLQGQFRDSDVSYSFAQIEPVMAEAWFGLVMQVFEQTELSYTLHYQTAELREGQAARDAFWGAVQVAHAF